MRVQKDAQGIYDFDALVVEPRLARVGGEVVDVSMMPVAVSLALSKRASMTRAEMLAEASADAEASLRKTLQMVSDVCVVSNPKLTVDFLMKNLGGPKLTAFVQFVLRPVVEKAEEVLAAGDEGNAVADETT